MKSKRITFLIVPTLVLFLGCSNEIPLASIAVPYESITIIDVHNHDASGHHYKKSLKVWRKYGIDKVVLFGDISEPSAQRTDQIAFDAYLTYRDRIIPFIAGINIFDKSCITYMKERFNAGVWGVGEVVATSLYSPVASTVAWKGKHAMDGHFPEIYQTCAQYHKPILLHIDPTEGYPIDKLKEALTAYPTTKFIFGHANAYNSPANLEYLLENYDNIYMDFFAAFTAYNRDSRYTLADYVPLIKKYPDRFMVSSDSAYGIDYDRAYTAIYELFNLLEREVVVKIAGENFLKLYNL